MEGTKDLNTLNKKLLVRKGNKGPLGLIKKKKDTNGFALFDGIYCSPTTF
jgi:hypothetical protein